MSLIVNTTSNSSNNSNNDVLVNKKDVIDPITNSKKLSLVVLGSVLLISPLILIGNAVWLFTDIFTITGLPIQKHDHKDVYTICNSKRFIFVLIGVCNTNHIDYSNSDGISNQCIQWGNHNHDEWQVVNDNNIYFQRYDYDIVHEAKTLWPYIKNISILSTIISIINFIVILPLADFSNRFFYLDIQKIILLLSTISCLADIVVIGYILYLSSTTKILGITIITIIINYHDYYHL